MRSSLFMLFVLAGCGGDKSYSINFAAVVAGQPFACGQSYSGVGTTGTTIEPQDLRFYVHDLSLKRAGGTAQPLTLDEDGTWQHGGIALLDFEDGTGGCMTESPSMHTTITGKAPADDYDELDFTLGVPQDEDHLDVLTTAAPLNQPALFWSWVGGYKYAKIEVQSNANATWFFHLGAQTCSAASMSDIVCKYPNLASVSLSNFDPAKSTATFDLAALYATSNLDAQPDGVIDTSTGCMSFEGDPECPPLFDQLGLTFEGQGTAGAQQVFTAR